MNLKQIVYSMLAVVPFLNYAVAEGLERTISVKSDPKQYEIPVAGISDVQGKFTRVSSVNRNPPLYHLEHIELNVYVIAVSYMPNIAEVNALSFKITDRKVDDPEKLEFGDYLVVTESGLNVYMLSMLEFYLKDKMEKGEKIRIKGVYHNELLALDPQIIFIDGEEKWKIHTDDTWIGMIERHIGKDGNFETFRNQGDTGYLWKILKPHFEKGRDKLLFGNRKGGYLNENGVEKMLFREKKDDYLKNKR